jgi:hypothetical protein
MELSSLCLLHTLRVVRCESDTALNSKTNALLLSGQEKLRKGRIFRFILQQISASDYITPNYMN